MSSIAPGGAVVLSSPHAKSSKLSISDLSSSASFSIIFCLKKKKKIPKAWRIFQTGGHWPKLFQQITLSGFPIGRTEQTMVGLIHDLMHYQVVGILTTWSRKDYYYTLEVAKCACIGKKKSFIFGCSRCVFMESEIIFSSPSFVWLFNLFRRTWRWTVFKIWVSLELVALFWWHIVWLVYTYCTSHVWLCLRHKTTFLCRQFKQ